MTRWIGTAVGAAVVAATALALVPSSRSWIRMWDFPRLQIAVVGTLLLMFSPDNKGRRGHGPRALRMGLVASTLYQWLRIGRYTRLAPLEVEDAVQPAWRNRLSMVEANVMLGNSNPAPLLSLLRREDPDLIVCVETDRRCQALAPLHRSHPYGVEVPLDNTYGMLLRSRLPLEDVRVDYLTDPAVPSVHAVVHLRNGHRARLHCLHPPPPAPDKARNTRQRDTELALVARQVRDGEATIVCGDLNDVAWSRTTRGFQAMSGLVDPRKGRGMFATFHASIPGLRFPLDHCFHSSGFRLVRLAVLPAIGSDHFPLVIVLEDGTGEDGR